MQWAFPKVDAAVEVASIVTLSRVIYQAICTSLFESESRYEGIRLLSRVDEIWNPAWQWLRLGNVLYQNRRKKFCRGK